MTCVTCKNAIEPSARFCSACGSPTPANPDCKLAENIECFWLEEILRARGYSLQVDAQEHNALRATAANLPAIDVAFSQASKLILLMVEKIPENQSPFGKIKGFHYINVCNNELKFWKARWDDADNTVYFSFILAVSDSNTRERMHTIICPVIDEMISCYGPV